MAPIFPTANNFPSAVKLAIVAAPSSIAKAKTDAQPPPVNILILLHGLGDSNASFTALAQQLSLPETACIAVQAPSPLPFDLGGFHWGDDIVFDQANGGIDLDAGFVKSSGLIYDDIIRKGLIEQCGFQARQILFLGYGQGGMAALQVAAHTDLEFGGVVSIGGALPSAAKPPSAKRATPVLLLGGSSISLITTSAVRSIKDTFAFVQVHQWPRPGDTMPANRDEMFPIMQFFARRLQSRAGVPEGSIPLS